VENAELFDWEEHVAARAKGEMRGFFTAFRMTGGGSGDGEGKGEMRGFFTAFRMTGNFRSE
jgi:hypothetical protein